LLLISPPSGQVSCTSLRLSLRFYHPHPTVPYLPMDSSLTALSPVDVRYRAATEDLAALLSESGLVRERIRVAALWLQQQAKSLASHASLPFAPAVVPRIAELAEDPGTTAASMVKTIEKRINHDVHAVDDVLRVALRFAGASPAHHVLVLLGCGSVATNHSSSARLPDRARAQVLLPALEAM